MEEVVLAHVLQGGHTEGLDQLLAKEARPILERQKEVLEQLGINVITEMPIGREPARTLNDLAEAHDVSAVFIGSHGKGILKSAVFGSVTTDLLQLAERPVLIARIALLEGDTCRLVCRKMFTGILFPTDFSAASEHALMYLGKIAADTKCPIHIMHVLDEKPADPETAQRIEEGSRFLLDSKRQRLESMGAKMVSAELAPGEPAEVLLARAKEGTYSIIVMGSTGKGIVKGIFLGSVSNQVARHAELPVLLIPAVQ
jgi:nucleotide-binding universal stress UspA family protein